MERSIRERGVSLCIQMGVQLSLICHSHYHFIRSDDKRYMHDHGWSFLTLVLKGSYTDVSPDGRDVMKAGSIRYRKATHAHYVDVPEGGCWTLVFSGRSKRKWGFWVDGKFKRPLKYFHKFGHPPCSEQ